MEHYAPYTYTLGRVAAPLHSVSTLVLLYQDIFCYYYVSVLHLYSYSVTGHFRVSVRVRVCYYNIFRDWYMKYWSISSGSEFVRSPQMSPLVPVSSLLPLETVNCAEIPSKRRCPWCVSVMFQGHYFMYQSIKSYQMMMSYFKGTADAVKPLGGWQAVAFATRTLGRLGHSTSTQG